MKNRKYRTLSVLIGVILLCIISNPFNKAGILNKTSDTPTKGITVKEYENKKEFSPSDNTEIETSKDFKFEDIPEYNGQPSIEVNNNVPYFDIPNSTSEIEPYEEYGELDSLRRCTGCDVLISKENMPKEKRGYIGQIRPSGWHTVKYPGVIKDLYLYNRCHLIMYALTGQNANKNNLITGTRYLNTEGMLPLEESVTDYLRRTNNHVRYRVTPIFKDNELVARGVLMECMSVEDKGNFHFCRYVYNVQPNVKIDYSTGESSIE